MNKIYLNSTVVLLFGLLCPQNVNAQEGYSPYSGTTSTDFQNGGKFDLNTDSGVNAWKQFNSPPPPIAIIPTPAVNFINNSFVIDKLNSVSSDSGELVTMNVFNRGYADAALEVYDANGKLVGTPIFIEGNRPTSSVVDFVISGGVSISKGVIDEYPWSDVRDAGGNTSKKTDIKDIFVPYGGYVKVTKSSALAAGFNLATIGLEMLNQLGLPSGKGTVDQKMLSSIVAEIAKLGPDFIKKIASRGSIDWSDVSLLVKIVGNVVIEPSNFDGRKKYTKLLGDLDAFKLGSKATLGSFKAAAEALALFLNTEGQLYDLTKSIEYDGNSNTTREAILYANKESPKNHTHKSNSDENVKLLYIQDLESITEPYSSSDLEFIRQAYQKAGWAVPDKPNWRGMLQRALKFFKDDLAGQNNNTASNTISPWATVTMQNQLSAITVGGTSHIGSASLYAGINNQVNANVNPNNTNNSQLQTGAQQAGYASNTQAFQSSAWVLVTGDPATHLAAGNSFGSITAPNGGQIASLNNANLPYTLVTKDFYVPVGVKQVTLTFNGNFVTNEYPAYVGSIYNDYATVKITSPSGNVTPVTAFNQTLNSGNFVLVNGLPAPLDTAGGQTGFKASSATIAVAGGGVVTVQVKVANVGDTAVPSAVLLNNITVK